MHPWEEQQAGPMVSRAREAPQLHPEPPGDPTCSAPSWAHWVCLGFDVSNGSFWKAEAASEWARVQWISPRSVQVPAGVTVAGVFLSPGPPISGACRETRAHREAQLGLLVSPGRVGPPCAGLQPPPRIPPAPGGLARQWPGREDP